MDKEKKREIQDAYKQRPTSGGVYRIYNTKTDSSFIRGDVDLAAVENRFRFSQKTGSCVVLSLQQEWKQWGPAAFDYEVLETIEISPEEDLGAFKRRLKARQEHYKAISMVRNDSTVV